MRMQCHASFMVMGVYCLTGCSEEKSAVVRSSDLRSIPTASDTETSAELRVREIASRFSVHVADEERNNQWREPFTNLRDMNFVPAGSEYLRAELVGQGKPRTQINLPMVASGQAMLEDLASGISVRFSLLNVEATPFERIRSGLLFRKAHAGAFDVLHLVRRDVLEDFVFFDNEPAREYIRYDIDVSSVAGMRLVGNVLEFLDAGGAPRLRVTRPWLIDSRGEFIRADLDVVPGAQGVTCAVDRTAALPWGRVPTAPCNAPGACHCEIEVSWENRGVAYPALLDPSWSATNTMCEARAGAAKSPLPGNRFMAIGGRPLVGGATATTEIFDESSGTWTCSGTMNSPHQNAVASTLDDGRVLVVSGRNESSMPIDATELYDPQTNTWTTTTSMPTARRFASATKLLDGRILIAGGRATTSPLQNVQLFDPKAESWALGGSMHMRRESHTATFMSDGTVVVIGGANGNSTEKNAVVERYDPNTNQWEDFSTLLQARSMHTATLLPDESILVCGGFDNANQVLATCERLPKGATQWLPAPIMHTPRFSHTASMLNNDRILIAGGADHNQARLKAAEVLLPGAEGWLEAEPMEGIRSGHVDFTLNDGRVLIAGGFDKDKELDTAEIFDLLVGGEVCQASGSCESTLCANGVCCDQPCPGPCYACAHVDKGSGSDGICDKIPGDHCNHYECFLPSDGGACKTSCMTDADCVAGFACKEPTGECVPNTQWYCEGNVSTPADDKTPTVDCQPYACVDGNCNTMCDHTSDCSNDAGCNVETHACAYRAAVIVYDPGCTCAIAGNSQPNQVLALLGLAFPLSILRRRRSQRSARRVSL